MPLGDQTDEPVGEQRTDDQVGPLRVRAGRFAVPERERHIAVAVAQHLDRAGRFGVDE